MGAVERLRIEQRAVRLALDSMWTYDQVVCLLEQYPAMSDEEARICLEVAQQQYVGAMLATLERAVGIFAKLEVERVTAIVVGQSERC